MSRCPIFARLAIFSVFLSWIIGCAQAETANDPALPLSSRLRKLLQDAAAEPSAVERFWSECKGHCPIVEPTDDPQQFLVTFLWQGDANLERVEVRGGPYEHSRVPFQRLPKTDVWYRSEVLPADSRYVYGLVVTSVTQQPQSDGTIRRELVKTYPLDPLNPNVFNEGPVVELPGAPQDSWHIARDNVPKGELRVSEIASAALGENRRVRLYLPANFNPKRAHSFAVFLDGEDYDRLMAVPTVLDNLIAADEIPPTVALLVDSQNSRGTDLVFSDSFVRFLTDEAIPWAKSQCQLNLSPKNTLIGGASLGGLTAAYAAHRRPDVFGNVLSQSGAFWRPNPAQSESDAAWFPREAAKTTPDSVRYYLEVGRFESPSMIEDNRRVRDLLRANGNRVFYQEYNGGHDHFNWRTSIAGGIVSLLGRKQGETGP